jgi:hypothetical protein
LPLPEKRAINRNAQLAFSSDEMLLTGFKCPMFYLFREVAQKQKIKKTKTGFGNDW